MKAGEQALQVGVRPQNQVCSVAARIQGKDVNCGRFYSQEFNDTAGGPIGRQLSKFRSTVDDILELKRRRRCCVPLFKLKVMQLPMAEQLDIQEPKHLSTPDDREIKSNEGGNGRV
eukprot:TRINITY_DN26919_c0_g1_i1.p3 TRINITY_DN26919_c0_g1~~TRINITY_DN26919_c0_g1_i1.p3  ORF type:complete len:116 (+),score=0.58 TRINITY_DN26919_c0_g1_i1:842-1189(+)